MAPGAVLVPGQLEDARTTQWGKRRNLPAMVLPTPSSPAASEVQTLKHQIQPSIYNFKISKDLYELPQIPARGVFIV